MDVAEAVHPDSTVARAVFQPLAHAECLHFRNCSRCQPVTTGFVAREIRRIHQQHVIARARSPGRSSGAGGSGTHHQHVGVHVRILAYCDDYDERVAALLDRFEQRLDRLVNGAFAKAFKAEVQPVEVAAALQRELDDRAVVIGAGRTVVPNIFTIEFSSRDFERLMAFEAPLRTELMDVVKEHANTQQYLLIGGLDITFMEDPTLDTGLFRVRAEAKDTGTSEPTDTSTRRGPHVTVNGLVHPLTRHTTKIGRGTDADIRIDDTGVSRHHAEIVLSVPIILRDLESTNGTWIGKERITEVELDRDTEIRIGPATIQFHVK